MLEIYAVGWHVLHGSTAHFKSPAGAKYDVEVPVFAMAALDEGGGNLGLFVRSVGVQFGTRVATWGSMTFSASLCIPLLKKFGRLRP